MTLTGVFNRLTTSPSSTIPLIRVQSTPSTNDLAIELLADARIATPHLTTVIADDQTDGHGRLGRAWHSLPGRSLTASTILSVPASLGTDPTPWFLHAGALAVRDALTALLSPLGRSVTTKWPNDVLVDSARKISGLLGVLAPASSPFVTTCVLGYGVNVSMDEDERPTPTATSLSLEGVEARRGDPVASISSLLEAIVRGLDTRVRALVAADGDASRSGLADEAHRRCSTLGRRIRVAPAADASGDPYSPDLAEGVAQALRPDDGSLVVRMVDGSSRTITAGDIHVID